MVEVVVLKEGVGDLGLGDLCLGDLGLGRSGVLLQHKDREDKMKLG